MAVTRERIGMTRYSVPDEHGFSINDYRLLAEGYIADHVVGTEPSSRTAVYQELESHNVFISVLRSDIRRKVDRVVDAPLTDNSNQFGLITPSELPRAVAGLIRVHNKGVQRELRLHFKGR